MDESKPQIPVDPIKLLSINEKIKYDGSTSFILNFTATKSKPDNQEEFKGTLKVLTQDGQYFLYQLPDFLNPSKTESSINTTLEEDNRACDAQDQSSAESLLKTVIACHNANRTMDIKPLLIRLHIQSYMDNLPENQKDLEICCLGCGNPFEILVLQRSSNNKDHAQNSPINIIQIAEPIIQEIGIFPFGNCEKFDFPKTLGT